MSPDTMLGHDNVISLSARVTWGYCHTAAGGGFRKVPEPSKGLPVTMSYSYGKGSAAWVARLSGSTR